MDCGWTLGGGHIIFAFSGVRRPTWFPDILGNSSYPIFTKFGMQVYWVNSLYGIAFYCVNTSYPMDNSLSGRRRPARQTSEKDVLCLHRPGRSNAVHSPGGVWYFLPV